jgi:hypothetical protein
MQDACARQVKIGQVIMPTMGVLTTCKRNHDRVYYCGYTTLRTRNRQIWKCVWPKNTMSYKNVLYDLNTEFSTSTKFSTSTTSVCTHTAVEQPVGLLPSGLPSTSLVLVLNLVPMY